jgi:hypothetical protein
MFFFIAALALSAATPTPKMQPALGRSTSEFLLVCNDEEISGLCYSYVVGVAQGISSLAALSGSNPLICIEENETMDSMGRKTTKIIENSRNVSYDTLPASLSVTAALIALYPCTGI